MIETPKTIRILLLSFTISSLAGAQDSSLLTGKRLQTELNRPGTIYWSDSPIREAFAGITNNRHVPVWIDRRCDPSQTVTLISQAALHDCLWELTQINEQLDVAWSRDLVYVGPPGEANRWATVNQRHREMLKRLPRAQRDRWMSARSWHWDRLKNPQDLLRDLESELGLSIQGGHLIEHDLWPAAAYPPLPLFVRLELLLAGYGQTFVFAANGSAIVRRMPVAPRVTKVNPIEPGHPKEKTLSEILNKSPSAELSENRLQLTAGLVRARDNPPSRHSNHCPTNSAGAKECPVYTTSEKPTAGTISRTTLEAASAGMRVQPHGQNEIE